MATSRVETNAIGQYGWRHLVGALAGNWASSAIWWVEPLLMREIAIQRGFGEAAAGLLICIELAAMSTSSAILTKFVPTPRLARVAAIGILVAIAASIPTLITSSFAVLLVARGLVGAGAGAALTMSNAVAAGFADPDRAFGRVTVGNILFGMVLIPGVAALRGVFVLSPSYGAILVVLAVALVLVLATPATHRSGSMAHDDGPITVAPRQMRNIWLIALGTFLIGMISGTLWAFYAVIGDGAGLTPGQVDAAVSASIFAGLVGAGLASLLGGRLGRFWPLCFSITVMSVAVVVLTYGPGPLVFRIATCFNVGALYFMLPYLLGAGSAQHSSGRGAGYVGAAFYLTGALGPVTGGVLAETVGLRSFGFAVVVLAALVIGIFLWVELRGGDDDASETLARNVEPKVEGAS